MAYKPRSIVSHISRVLLVAVVAALSLPLDWAFAQTVPDPLLLPVARTDHESDVSTYTGLEVPIMAAGGSYIDPTTKVRVYKLTSSTWPTTGFSWGHFYSEGPDEVSLPHTGTTRTIVVVAANGSKWLTDFTPGVGVSNARQLTGAFFPSNDLSLTFSNNPATPYYAYIVTNNGSAIRRFDIRGSTPTEVPGGGWPVTGETVDEGAWLHQSANDGLFTWMRPGSVMVGYEPSTGTKKARSFPNGNEPRIDRGGRYIGISMNDNGANIWDWQTDTIVWTNPGSPRPFAHQASCRRRWYAVDTSSTWPSVFARFIPDVPNSDVSIGGPAHGTLVYGNCNWIQNPANLGDQWALFHTYNNGPDLVPTDGSGWLAPGGMIFITENGERRLLGFPYNTQATQQTGEGYRSSTFAKLSPDGAYVLFTSDMNGSGRFDLFLAEVPTASGDTTPPTVAITGPTNGTTVSGTVTVAANASDNVGVVGVQFRLDGANLGAEDTTAPYAISWNTTTATNGAHTLTAVARDAAGNTSTSAAVTVTVATTR